MSDLSGDELRGMALGRLLLHAHRHAQAASLAKLQQRGHDQVRPGHVPVFMNVDDGGTKITDLAARAGMTRQMMGRLVRELEELGYVSSRPDPRDQRAVIVSLTALGNGFLADAPGAMADVDREYAELLGSAELHQLRENLVKLLTS